MSAQQRAWERARRAEQRSLALLAGPLFAALACTQTPTSSEESSGAPPPGGSRPSSLPAGHSTSTAAVDLDALFVPPEPLPEVVARVEGEPVSRDAFVHELRQMQIQFSATGLPAELTRQAILRGALNRAVEHLLREMLAEDLGVAVEPSEVEAWKADVEDRMKSDPAFRTFLLRAGKDEAQRAIDAQRQVMFQGILDKVREEIKDELTDEARAYYDRHPNDYIERAGVEVWRILIKAPVGMMQRERDLARLEAEELHKKIKKRPKTFENVAIGSSAGGKANEGGYLGYVPDGALSPELEAQIKKAKPGTLLPLYEDAVGFWIYKVGKRREERPIPFEEVKDAIIERVYGPFVRKRVDDRVEALRANKKVEVLVPELTMT